MFGRSVLRWPSIALLSVLAGCGGGGAHSGPVPSASTGSVAGGTALTLRINVPETGAASARRPAYVSASTQSIAVVVLGANAQPLGAASVNLTPSSPACQTVLANGVTSLACSLAVPVNITASGSYTIDTATYDQAQTQSCSLDGTPHCAGNVLSASSISATLTLNAANVVSVVLGGLANGFAVAPVVNGFFQGSLQAGLQLWGPQAQTLSVAALDADGNTIIGSGAPAVTVTSSTPNVRVANVSAGTFSIQAMTSGAPPAVTPGTATLTLTATPVGSPATPFSQTMSLKLDHTAVFVSNGTNVLVFLDGNTASSATLPGTSSPRGVAVDAHGTVYVGNHTAPGSITECPESGAYLTCTTPITGPSFIEGVAIDPAGNLWISSNGSCVIEYPAGQTTANVTITTAFNTLRGVSVDTNNELWVADQSSSTIAGYAAPFTPTMTPFATLTSAAGVAAPIQVSSDASGNLWAAMCGASSCGGWGSGALQYAPPITSASAPAITLTGNGISAPEGVAIDAVASIWIASPTNGMVTHCLPPAGTLPCTSFAVPGALWIAAYPSDIDP